MEHIPVTSQLVRQNNADFPIVADVDTLGGLRVVQDNVERDNIPSTHLKLQMRVVVQTPTPQLYRLTQISPPIWTAGEPELIEYANLAAFPLPSTVPGQFAWAQDTNLLYAAVEGSWQIVGGAAATGITAAMHRTLRQLIHFISEGPTFGFASGAFREVLPAANPFPTSVVWWESAAKLKKIVDKLIARNPNKTPSAITWHMYDTDGVTVVETVTDTITYSGIFETSRIRTIS